MVLIASRCVDLIADFLGRATPRLSASAGCTWCCPCSPATACACSSRRSSTTRSEDGSTRGVLMSVSLVGVCSSYGSLVALCSLSLGSLRWNRHQIGLDFTLRFARGENSRTVRHCSAPGWVAPRAAQFFRLSRVSESSACPVSARTARPTWRCARRAFAMPTQFNYTLARICWGVGPRARAPQHCTCHRAVPLEARGGTAAGIAEAAT